MLVDIHHLCRSLRDHQSHLHAVPEVVCRHHHLADHLRSHCCHGHWRKHVLELGQEETGRARGKGERDPGSRHSKGVLQVCDSSEGLRLHSLDIDWSYRLFLDLLLPQDSSRHRNHQGRPPLTSRRQVFSLATSALFSSFQ